MDLDGVDFAVRRTVCVGDTDTKNDRRTGLPESVGGYVESFFSGAGSVPLAPAWRTSRLVWIRSSSVTAEGLIAWAQR